MARIKEQEIFVNPYVVQMDKFAESLQHLSKTFLNMEHYKGTLSKEEIDEIYQCDEDDEHRHCEQCHVRGEISGASRLAVKFLRIKELGQRYQLDIESVIDFINIFVSECLSRTIIQFLEVIEKYRLGFLLKLLLL